MNYSAAATAGLTGAGVITLTHEAIRQFVPKAPRMDLLGMEAISKGFKKAGVKQPDGNTLYAMAIAGDLVSNALYYSMAGIGKSRNAWKHGLALGLAAGLGAVYLPRPLGLQESHSARTTETKLMTIGLYVLGGLVTSLVLRAMEKRKFRRYREDVIQ